MPERVLAIANALLEAVEALPPDMSGAFVLASDGIDRGMVVAEHNRVVWATATGLSKRLKLLMAEHAGLRLDRERFLSTPGIERALFAHSTESLIALCGPGEGTIRWIPRDRPLDAPVSFAPTELLAAMGARLYSKEATTARESIPLPGSGGSFAIGDDDDLAVVEQVGGERLGVSSLLELGSWAAAALDATTGFTPAMIERALFGAQHHIALAWRTARRVVHAVIFEDRHTIDHALSALRDQRIPAVVSICVPWKLSPTQ